MPAPGGGNKTQTKELGLLVTLAALVLVFTGVSRIWTGTWAFFSPENFSNISGQVVVVGVLAITMTMVILVAEIDIGVGSALALCAVVACLAMQKGLPLPLALLLALATGALIGVWNGFWISRYGIHSFIITLGMLVIGRGLAQIVSGGQNVSPQNEAFTSFFFLTVPPVWTAALILAGFVVWCGGQIQAAGRRESLGLAPWSEGQLVRRLVAGFAAFAFGGWVFCGSRGLPLPFLLWLALLLGGMFVLEQTVFGRRLYAVGGNPLAAGLAGIPVPATRWTVFILSGLAAAVAGILAAAREGGATPGNIGRLAELDAVAAVVIGGTSLMGGVGNLTGTVLGLFLLAVLANGMSIMGIPTNTQEVIKGLIIIFAAWFDARTRKGK
jgi:D-xylose transport system permease protein